MRFILTILFTLIAFIAFAQEGDPLNNAVKNICQQKRITIIRQKW